MFSNPDHLAHLLLQSQIALAESHFTRGHELCLQNRSSLRQGDRLPPWQKPSYWRIHSPNQPNRKTLQANSESVSQINKVSESYIVVGIRRVAQAHVKHRSNTVGDFRGLGSLDQHESCERRW